MPRHRDYLLRLSTYRLALRAAGLTTPEAVLAASPELRHQHRHCFASLALDAGVPIQDVSVALGHASVATTMAVYSWYLGQGQRRAAKALGQVIAGPHAADGAGIGARGTG